MTMVRKQTDLEKYDNYPYDPGGGTFKRLLWYFVNVFFFKSSLFPFYGLKVALLRLFGARVGKKVELKPCINIKYPWNLEIGDEVWIGENVWLDSLVKIRIGSNVCLSQGAILLTGSHNYKKTTFDLIVGEIHIQDGVWIGAGAIVNQGVVIGSHTVVTTGSVISRDTDPYGVYSGNPAILTRNRIIE
jgi:putative colanic acid biosynthesis acetyltransferase WcaF